MIALKYIDEDERWTDDASNIVKYRSFFSDVMDKMNDALPLSFQSKAYYIQGLAIIEMKAHFNIINQRCWVTTNEGHSRKMYEDSGQQI